MDGTSNRVASDSELVVSRLISYSITRCRRGGERWKAVLMAAIGSKTNNLGGGDKGMGWCGQIIARTRGSISGRGPIVRPFSSPFARSLAYTLSIIQRALHQPTSRSSQLPCRSKLSISIRRNDALLTIGYCGEPQSWLIPQPATPKR